MYSICITRVVPRRVFLTGLMHNVYTCTYIYVYMHARIYKIHARMILGTSNAPQGAFTWSKKKHVVTLKSVSVNTPVHVTQ